MAAVTLRLQTLRILASERQCFFSDSEVALPVDVWRAIFRGDVVLFVQLNYSCKWAYSCVTIQVKTNLKPKPGGGKGKLALDWWVPEDSPVDMFALVDVSEQRIWMFTRTEMQQKAQQHPQGRLHFYIFTDLRVKRRSDAPAAMLEDFEDYLLENRIGAFF